MTKPIQNTLNFQGQQQSRGEGDREGKGIVTDRQTDREEETNGLTDIKRAERELQNLFVQLTLSSEFIH